MKVIFYKFLSAEVNSGTDETPVFEPIYLEKSMGWSEANEEIARREAYNGEYTIEDDGVPEPEPEPDLESRVVTLEEDSSDMKQALNMILTGVTE